MMRRHITLSAVLALLAGPAAAEIWIGPTAIPNPPGTTVPSNFTPNDISKVDGIIYVHGGSGKTPDDTAIGESTTHKLEDWGMFIPNDMDSGRTIHYQPVTEFQDSSGKTCTNNLDSCGYPYVYRAERDVYYYSQSNSNHAANAKAVKNETGIWMKVKDTTTGKIVGYAVRQIGVLQHEWVQHWLLDSSSCGSSGQYGCLNSSNTYKYTPLSGAPSTGATEEAWEYIYEESNEATVHLDNVGKSGWLRAKSEERRAKSEERRAKSEERRAIAVWCSTRARHRPMIDSGTSCPSDSRTRRRAIRSTSSPTSNGTRTCTRARRPA